MNIFLVPLFFLFSFIHTSIYTMDPVTNPDEKQSNISEILTTNTPKKVSPFKRPKRTLSSLLLSPSATHENSVHSNPSSKNDKPHSLPSFSSENEKKNKKLDLFPKNSYSASSEKGITQNSSRKKKSLRSQSPRNATPSSSEPKQSNKLNIAVAEFDFLRKAMQSEDIFLIKTFLENPINNPNLQSVTGKNTLLHHAILNVMNHGHKKTITMLFLLNPRINSLIKNEYNNAAYQLITEDSLNRYEELYNELRTRALLDHIVNAILIIHQALTPAISENVIMEYITEHHVLYNIPKQILPCYANARFITAMIWSRLKYDALTIQKDRDAYDRDINYQDDWGNTLLHHAAYLYNKNLIQKLVRNPNILFQHNHEKRQPQALLSSMIQPKKKITPEEKIALSKCKKNIRKIRAILFMGDTIRRLIATKIPDLLLIKLVTGAEATGPNPIVSQPLNLDKDIFMQIKNEILDQLNAIEVKQKDKNSTQLPKKNVTLPAYANDAFFLQVFHAQMKQHSTITMHQLGFNPYPSSSTESSEIN